MDSSHVWIVQLALFVILASYYHSKKALVLYGWARHQPIIPPQHPRITSKDVTVILPTLVNDEAALRETLLSVDQNCPAEILLVAVDENGGTKRAVRVLQELSLPRVKLLSTAQANKRKQIIHALHSPVETPYIVLCDDDVFWKPQQLQWMLAPFEEIGRLGAVVTNQRARRNENPSIYNWLGIGYLQRRNRDVAACCYFDGGTPCMSGRTVMYRSDILQAPGFKKGFGNEMWNDCILNADDDNFMTRWLVNDGWKMWMQYHKDCELETTLETNHNFLKQCERWQRSNWRSNLTSMFFERNIWTRHPWTTYFTYVTTLTTWSLAWDILLPMLFHKVLLHWSLTSLEHWGPVIGYVVLMQSLKCVTYVEQLKQHPSDARFLIVTIVFGWLHGIIKIRTLFSLNSTAWGSREGADANDASRLERPPEYAEYVGEKYDDIQDLF